MACSFEKRIAPNLKRRGTGWKLEGGRRLHGKGTGGCCASHSLRMCFREVLLSALLRFVRTGTALEQTSERKAHQRMKRPDLEK